MHNFKNHWNFEKKYLINLKKIRANITRSEHISKYGFNTSLWKDFNNKENKSHEKIKEWKSLIWNCFILFFDLSSNLHRYDLSTLALYYFNADYLFSLSGQRQRQDKANKQMDTALSTVITAGKIYLSILKPHEYKEWVFCQN